MEYYYISVNAPSIQNISVIVQHLICIVGTYRNKYFRLYERIVDSPILCYKYIVWFVLFFGVQHIIVTSFCCGVQRFY